jgi:FixJ family two-component response regulator
MTMRIAIVDDDESIRRSLMRLLQHSGLRPSAFRTAEEFLASPLRDAFGCLVVDVQLRPGCMSGLELRRRLLERGDHTPVIFLTAHDDAETQAEVGRLGSMGFFQKGANPMSLVELLLRIERGECTPSNAGT